MIIAIKILFIICTLNLSGYLLTTLTYNPYKRSKLRERFEKLFITMFVISSLLLALLIVLFMWGNYG